MNQSKSHKLSSWRQAGDIEIIPPNDDDFAVYGMDETVEAARDWALKHHYVLVKGVEACAHGLLGLNYCPASCRRIRDFDHANVWARVDGGRTPHAFVLAAPYSDGPSPELREYAKYHGLYIESNPWDGWYGHGSTPIKLSFEQSRVSMNPLEESLVLLGAIAPSRWPDDPETA